MALLFLIFLFGGYQAHHCPPLHPITVPIYETYAEYKKSHPPIIEKIEGTEYSLVSYQATTTYELVGSEWSDSDQHWKIKGIQVGEKPDPEAIVYNKRVEKCKTVNGEF